MISRLVCVARGHVDVVTVLFPPGAVVTCDRCGRQRLIELRAKIPVPAAAGLVVQVDRDALEQLQLGYRVNAIAAEELAHRLEGEA